jgi:hypothetical protein
VSVALPLPTSFTIPTVDRRVRLEGGTEVRRTATILAVVALMLVSSSGVARAAQAQIPSTPIRPTSSEATASR